MNKLLLAAGFGLFPVSNVFAGPIVLQPNQEIDLVCRGVFKATNENLFIDTQEVTLQTSTGPLRASVIAKMKVAYGFKFSTHAISINFLNLALGECGVINNVVQSPQTDQFIYTELKGDNTLFLTRDSQFFNGPGEVRYSIHRMNATAFVKNCTVYQVHAKMIGTGPSFNTVLPSANQLNCAQP